MLVLVVVLGPRSGCFAAGFADSVDKRLPEEEHKAITARVANRTGPTAAPIRPLSCAQLHVSLA